MDKAAGKNYFCIRFLQFYYTHLNFNRSFLSFLLSILGVLTGWTIPLFAQDCDLKKDLDSIKVYTCRVDDLKFKSVKATFTVNESLSTLTAFLLDIEKYSEWQYNTVHPRILKKISEAEIIYYSIVEAPWPISDRDMVVHLTVSQDLATKTVTIISNGVPENIPKEEGLVRVPMSTAKWTIRRLSAKKVSVEYTIKIDPGGSVPAWMVNMVCAEAPYISFKNLRAKIGTYGSHALPFIVN